MTCCQRIYSQFLRLRYESSYKMIITFRQIEAARRAMVRQVKRWGKIWIRIFPDKPYTTKPLKFQWVEVNDR